MPTARRTLLLQGGLCLIFLARIVSGYSLFTDTYDEHAHVLRGLWWLERGFYEADGFQTPLPRLFAAALPHLDGFVTDGSWLVNEWDQRSLDDYWRSLTLARIGVLPFAIALFAAVALWSRRELGDNASLVATGLLTASPTVLGHAGLATLDMAGAAGVFLATWAVWSWAHKQRPHPAALAGAALGLAEISKFSSLGFLAAPVLFAAWFAVRKQGLPPRRLILHAALYAAAAGAVVWAGYGFTTGEVYSYRHAVAVDAGAALPLGEALQGVDLPAPVFWQGFVDMAYLQRDGFPSYLLGESRQGGWWYYFPLALLLKLTPPFLLLALLGSFVLLNRKSESRDLGICLIVAAAWILIISMPSRVNIGVRHVLPVFPLLAMLGAATTARLASRGAVRYAVFILLGWHAVESVVAHPDYVAYFNPFVRSQDYAYLSDSNLDWGQDRGRFLDWLKANEDKDVFALEMQAGGILRSYAFEQGSPQSEWIVLGANQLILLKFGGQQPELAELVDAEPWGRIGRSIFIYRNPRTIETPGQP